MRYYDSKSIEKKWSKHWIDNDTNKTEENDKEKLYILSMFPYPSGDGLHVGHTRGYIATDVYARHKRMKGFKVLLPMGWDAFGTPAERYAIKNKINPKKSVKNTIARFKGQLNRVGLSYDWDREIATTDENYYKWTQWTFLQMYKKGLIYPSNEPVLWCDECKTSLAQEDLEGDEHERCHTVVSKKQIRQWVIKIRDYADRLLDDLDTLDQWPDQIKDLQRDWIGRGNGHAFSFEVEDSDVKIPVFTTRLDTLFGVTFISIAPESKLALELLGGVKNTDEVKHYIEEISRLPDLARAKDDEHASGICLEGVTAVHPLTKEKIPIFLSSYVLASYGTGAVMGVAAHDIRDYEFAKTHNLDIREVVHSTDSDKTELPFIDMGVLVNSGEYSGLTSQEAKSKMAEDIPADKKTFYKLRNWVFARQIYWGEPIPLINCEDGTTQIVPDDELPLILPDVENYEPTGTGESPLANIKEWTDVNCKNGKGVRETNTMPTWAGSSWYFLRFIDPHNDNELIDPTKEKAWMPVDLYVGGIEHATRHLIYARFWHKFLYDIGVVSELEPFKKLLPVGLIYREGAKMSKSKGNVIDPVDIIDNVGADAYRLYIVFMGPFEKAIEWNDNGIVGTRKFLEKVYALLNKVSKDAVETSDELNALYNITIKKVEDDINKLRLNTAVSQMMILVNKMSNESAISIDMYVGLLKILAPFCPFVTEELFERLPVEVDTNSIHKQIWPIYEKNYIEMAKVKVAIQVNSKLKGVVEASQGATEAEIMDIVRVELPNIKDILDSNSYNKVIFVENKILNILINIV